MHFYVNVVSFNVLLLYVQCKALLCICLEIIKSYYEHIGNTIMELIGMYNMIHNEKQKTSRNITNTPLRKKHFYNLRI